MASEQSYCWPVVVCVGVVPAERRCSPASCCRRRTASRSCPALLIRFHSQVPAGERLAALGRVVVAVLAHADDARVGRVGVDRERLAEAHRVDLGTGLGRADREQVAGRDRVRRVDARARCRPAMSPCLGVMRMILPRRSAEFCDVLRASQRSADAVVHRRVAAVAGRVRGDVVADAEVQVAGGVEVQAGAADVAGAGVGRAAREAGRASRRSWPWGRAGSRARSSGSAAVPSAVSVKRLIWL